ncbi:MAG: C69 family dipeptidase [Aerococcus sp.]|nr:C69 family dipeptidase [Aerococcus sp.]
MSHHHSRTGGKQLHFIWISLIVVILSLIAPLYSAKACTAVYVGKDLTEDGSTIFARTEDLEPHHNKTFVVKGEQKHKKGDKFKDEAYGFTMPLPDRSFRYTALPDVTPEEGIFDEAGTNEYGVMMDATVSCYTKEEILKVDPLVEEGGISEGAMTTAVLPYVRTAREGVERLTHLVEENGNAEPNALIIADQKETWYVELLSGHQYAAVKLPEDRFVVFPNAFFLDTIDTKSRDVIASVGLVSTAKKAGTLVEKNGKIHVSNSYADKIADGTKSRYWRGVQLLDEKSEITLDTPDEELPFYHQTDKKISLQDIMALQRDRYEGSGYKPQDKSSTGTGKEDKKEENLPLSKHEGLYPIGNENTMEAHIFQVFGDLPKEAPAIMWEAIGSPLVSPYLPYFGNIQETAKPYQVTTEHYDDASYYWATDKLLTQLLAHEKETKKAIREDVEHFEAPYQKQAMQWKQTMTKKHKKNAKEADTWITKKTVEMGNEAFKSLKNWEKHYVKE